MFERMEERVARRTRGIAAERTRELAERLREEAPAGVEIMAAGTDVELRGRGLRRRSALEPRLRTLLARWR